MERILSGIKKVKKFFDSFEIKEENKTTEADKMKKEENEKKEKEHASEIHDSFNSEDSSHKHVDDSFKNIKDSNIKF